MSKLTVDVTVTLPAGNSVTLISGGLKPSADHPKLYEQLCTELRKDHGMAVVLIDPFAIGTRYSKYKPVGDALRDASTTFWGPPLVDLHDGDEVTDFRHMRLCVLDIVEKFDANPMHTWLSVWCEGGINRAAFVAFLVGMVMGVSFADMKATYDAAKVDRVLPEGQHGGTFEGISNRVFLGLLGQLAAVVTAGGDITDPVNWVLKAGTAVRASSRRGAGGAAVAAAPAPAPTPPSKRKRKGMGAADADEGGDEHPPLGLSRGGAACMYTPDPPRTGTRTMSRWYDQTTGEWKHIWHFQTPPKLCADPRPHGGGGAAVESTVVTPVVEGEDDVAPSLTRQNAVCEYMEDP